MDSARNSEFPAAAVRRAEPAARRATSGAYTISRLRTHSTEVMSVSTRSSSNPGLWLAKIPISHS
jgi:hypothetical protein